MRYGDLNDSDLDRLWTCSCDSDARDCLLLRRWSGGNSESGMELLGHYRNLFYRVCLRYGLKSEEDVADVYHDVIVDLLESLDELPLRIEKSFAGYLYWRTRKAIGKRWNRLPEVRGNFDFTAAEDLPGRIEAWEVIELCRKRLTALQRGIFDLRYIEELSLAEIAAALKSTANAVGQNIFRLSRKMRDCIRENSA